MQKTMFFACLLAFATGASKVPWYDPHRDGALAELDILAVWIEKEEVER